MKTKEQYLKDSGKCPYCNSEQLEGNGHDYEGDGVIQVILCQDCGNRWEDVFRLYDVEFLGGGK
jgi:C4-type Zn-finger protein